MAMKIIVAGPSGQKGGLEIHTTELVRFMRDEHHKTLFIKIPNQSTRGGALAKIRKALHWITAFSKARFFQPDLLISTAPGSGYRTLAGLLSGNCFRVFQVVTEDYPAHDQFMLSMLMAHDAVAAQTAILKEQVHNKLSSTIPCQVLPCFHQLERSYQPIPCASPSLSSGIRLAYFGRIAGNKGLINLLAAWQQLDGSIPCTLAIWGSGPLKPELHDLILASPHLQRTVSMHGSYPSGDDYTRLLSSYDGLVLPSQATEGLPLVLLEAASIGLPILTTSIGGIPDFALGNADVMLVNVGTEPLRSGLDKFISKIHAGHFNRSRHQDLFLEKYSISVIEQKWREMLANPRTFFQLPAMMG